MKVFACTRCHQLVFFENVSCVRCGQALAYLPDRGLMSGIDSCQDPGGGPIGAGGGPAAQRWRALLPDGGTYRLCRNWTDHEVCNWAVPESDPHDLCRACRLNGVIPALWDPATRAAWARVEGAKRRLVYSLLQLGLPVEPRGEDGARGLSFSFLQELPGQKVTTGHQDGVITLDLAEADDVQREKLRVRLGEPYRTLIGHFRHEIGHYYWLRLVSASGWLQRCRELFGDDRADYGEALRRHYQAGAPPNWPERFVSAYASMHPAEDFAETFAHYLHLADTLETARALGLSMRPEPAAGRGDDPLAVAPAALDPCDFDALLGAFLPLTLALNELSRSMGHPDTYPFVLPPPAVEKLRFAHDVVAASREGRAPA